MGPAWVRPGRGLPEGRGLCGGSVPGWAGVVGPSSGVGASAQRGFSGGGRSVRAGADCAMTRRRKVFLWKINPEQGIPGQAAFPENLTVFSCSRCVGVGKHFDGPGMV